MYYFPLQKHIIANTYEIGHEGDHIGSFANGFTMCDLRFFFIQILTSNPSILLADANENRVRVELSLKLDMARPESKTLGEMF